MKVRWTQGSVRFRISPTELAALERGEPVVEALTLPGGHWSATIRPGAARTCITMESGGQIHLALSEADRERLSAPDAEGVYFRDEGPEGGGGADSNREPLRYFIEKDFPCVHPRAAEAEEPTAETFAPPLGFEERKR